MINSFVYDIECLTRNDVKHKRRFGCMRVFLTYHALTVAPHTNFNRLQK